jgi:hypothetical protein
MHSNGKIAWSQAVVFPLLFLLLLHHINQEKFYKEKTGLACELVSLHLKNIYSISKKFYFQDFPLVLVC